MSAVRAGVAGERMRVEGANRSTSQQMPFRAYVYGMTSHRMPVTRHDQAIRPISAEAARAFEAQMESMTGES